LWSRQAQTLNSASATYSDNIVDFILADKTGVIKQIVQILTKTSVARRAKCIGELA
jgi:hypothetical protein